MMGPEGPEGPSLTGAPKVEVSKGVVGARRGGGQGEWGDKKEKGKGGAAQAEQAERRERGHQGRGEKRRECGGDCERWK